jgi:hypothetical protein
MHKKGEKEIERLIKYNGGVDLSTVQHTHAGTNHNEIPLCN